MSRLRSFGRGLYEWPMAIGYLALLFTFGFARIGCQAVKSRLSRSRDLSAVSAQSSAPVCVSSAAANRGCTVVADKSNVVQLSSYRRKKPRLVNAGGHGRATVLKFQKPSGKSRRQ